MANKLLKAAAALLLAGVTVGSLAACTFETPEWAEQALCDHVFDEKEILEEPTCGSSGTALKICTECGKTKHVTLSATGNHEFSDWEETTPPTAETPGEKARTCNVCGKTEKEEIPVQDIPEVQVHPDENHDGICDDCGVDYLESAVFLQPQDGEATSGWYRVESTYGLNNEVSGFPLQNLYTLKIKASAMSEDGKGSGYGEGSIVINSYFGVENIQPIDCLSGYYEDASFGLASGYSFFDKIYSTQKNGYVYIFVDELGGTGTFALWENDGMDYAGEAEMILYDFVLASPPDGIEKAYF